MFFAVEVAIVAWGDRDPFLRMFLIELLVSGQEKSMRDLVDQLLFSKTVSPLGVRVLSQRGFKII